uniref:Uncharacterized protein n=1 Tax=Rhizophora mucronata TaxID=61149 RepID=A0A2P2JEU6_RHIMU
MPVLTCVTES